MSEYIRINVKDYVIDGIDSGDLVPFTATKSAKVHARRGYIGELINTYTEGGVLEKENIVTIDDKTGKAGWVITKCDNSGNILVDESGNRNEWVISDSEFISQYKPDKNGLYKPVDGPQVFVPVLTNIILVQDGKEMKVAAGGYINITNIDHCYGISERDFNDTYQISEEKPQFKL